MPKVGMEPIRRDQIRRAAVRLIAKKGFDETTLRDVATVARVSTGTVNHYYKNKLGVLKDALLYVSEWFQRRTLEAIEKEPAGIDRLRALIRINVSNLADSPDIQRGCAVWLWALSECLKSRELFRIVQERRRLFQDLIANTLNGAFPELSQRDIMELAAEYDVILNGVCIHYVTGERGLSPEALERSLIELARSRVERSIETSHSSRRDDLTSDRPRRTREAPISIPGRSTI